MEQTGTIHRNGAGETPAATSPARFLDAARPATARPRSTAGLRPAAALALLAGSLATACGDPSGIDPESVTIQLEVSGGLASASWTLAVDGQAGNVRGVSCERGCDFQNGSVILPLSGFQVADIARQLEHAGVLGYDGRDFGSECCDQFEYRITYRKNLRESVITGSSGALPEPIREAVSRIHALAYGQLQAVVDFNSNPDLWPDDPLAIDSVTIDGPLLTAFLSWTGGCTGHSIDLVFWNGFLEPEPVQADAVFAHDARGDACEAIIHQARAFDLSPLRDAWRAAYGAGAGRIRLQLRPSGQNQTVTADYRF